MAACCEPLPLCVCLYSKTQPQYAPCTTVGVQPVCFSALKRHTCARVFLRSKHMDEVQRQQLLPASLFHLRTCSRVLFTPSQCGSSLPRLSPHFRSTQANQCDAGPLKSSLREIHEADAEMVWNFQPFILILCVQQNHCGKTEAMHMTGIDEYSPACGRERERERTQCLLTGLVCEGLTGIDPVAVLAEPCRGWSAATVWFTAEGLERHLSFVYFLIKL